MKQVLNKLKRLSKLQLQKLCNILNKKYKKSNTKNDIIEILLKPLNNKKYKFIEILGESIDSTSFQQRHPTLYDIQSNQGLFDPEKEGYLDICPRLDRLYKWSEIKSSFLMKQIIHSSYNNTSIYDYLTDYLQKLNLRLFTELSNTLENKISGQDLFENELDKYMEKLPYAQQKDAFRSYPVAQSPAWIGDKKGLYNNFYALWNFTKYVWMNLKFGNHITETSLSKCNVSAITYWMIIDIFQQNFLYFQDIIRGDRIDEKGSGMYNEFYTENDQIGITNIIIPALKRQVKGKPFYQTEPWIHPGEVQCRVPYRGGYGKQIKKYRDSKGSFDNFYGSLQCGISGSTQYILFMYLLSHTDFETAYIDTPKEDIRDVITSACLILTGDGGHNIREVISGLTVSIIILNNLLTDLMIELQDFFVQLKITDIPTEHKSQIYFIKKILNILNKDQLSFLITNYNVTQILYNYCDNKLQGKCNKIDITKVFANLILSLINWLPFVQEFYNYTRNFNIIGVDYNDMTELTDTLLKNGMLTDINSLKIYSYQYLFNPYGNNSYNLDITTGRALIQLQYLLGLDNNRFEKNIDISFKDMPNIIIREIINSYSEVGHNTLNDVNLQLEKLRCDYEDLSKKTLGYKTLTKTSINQIPFA